GLVNGAFYALLSLGLAVIFGMMRIVNFAHGAFYMLGAFVAYVLLQQAGIGFWPSLVIAPLAIALAGMVLERLLIRRIAGVDPLFGFLLTFGLSLLIQDAMRLRFGLQGQPYATPAELAGTVSLGAVTYPTYRLFVIAFSLAVSLAVWYAIERTRLGMVVRAATERAELTRALGVDVDRWTTPVFGFGLGLAALAGVLAAPMRNVSPLMGSELIILTFAVVVIGGMGSIKGAIAAGFLVGVLSSVGAIFDPAIEGIVAFAPMAVLLLVRPSGLFGSLETSWACAAARSRLPRRRPPSPSVSPRSPSRRCSSPWRTGRGRSPAARTGCRASRGHLAGSPSDPRCPSITRRSRWSSSATSPHTASSTRRSDTCSCPSVTTRLARVRWA